MLDEKSSNSNMMLPKIASIVAVIAFGISFVGGMIAHSTRDNFSGSSCSWNDIYRLNVNCLKVYWNHRSTLHHWDLISMFLEVIGIACFIPIFQGYKRIIKDKQSSEFMLGCIKLAVLFNCIDALYHGSSRAIADFLGSVITREEVFPEFHIAYMMTNNVFGWISSVDELMFGLAFLYMAALGSSTKILPNYINIVSVIIAIAALIAFISGVLYLLWNSLFWVEFVTRLVYVICLWIWCIMSYMLFRTLA